MTALPASIEPLPIQAGSWINRLPVIRSFPLLAGSGWEPAGYLILIAIAEGLGLFALPHLSLSLHGILLIVLLLRASLTHDANQGRFLTVLSLVPLIRLLSLIMPLTLFKNTFWTLIVGIPLLVSALLIFRFSNITPAMAGLQVAEPRLQIIVGASGILLGTVEYLILRPEPLVKSLHWSEIWLPALILFIFTGFLEEFIFRGLLQSSAFPYLRRYTILYIAAAFSLLHLGYLSVSDTIFVFCVAIYFGYIVKISRSIVGVTIAHGLINIMIFLILPNLPA